MNTRNLVILGSTGSIGRSAIEVVKKHPGRFNIIALSAYNNAELLEEQFRQFHPEYLCLVDEKKAAEFKKKLKGEKVKVLAGEEELIRLAGLSEANIVLNSVVGAAGLKASLEALKNDKDLALANKESLVAGGPLFPALVKKSQGKILPIDSEHSAIWQVLNAGQKDEIRHILLTSSGGPFRQTPIEEFADITPAMALKHPTWNMGRKITIDSATMANKGLEVIEACVLFTLSPDRIKVVIHPQSIIHSMVEFNDSSVIAQLSNPDMSLPITYALFWPERVESDFGRIDWSQIGSLTFEEPDFDKFKALKLAYRAAEEGGTAPAIYNAANEAAVQAFLDETIKFTDITDIIDKALNELPHVADPQLEDILEADRLAREFSRQLQEKISC